MEGCRRTYESSGFCSLHRSRFRQHGDPLKTGVWFHGTVQERARTKFIEGGPGECWLWTASRTPDGYAVLRSAGAGSPPAYGHRVVFEMYGGTIPDGYEVDHLCRVRHCVNPAHLEPVTTEENRRRAKVLRDPITGRFLAVG